MNERYLEELDYVGALRQPLQHLDLVPDYRFALEEVCARLVDHFYRDQLTREQVHRFVHDAESPRCDPLL